MAKPYKLQVVLRFSDHRDLTTVLKEKVERELRDNVRAAFGDLVQVDVTRTHPRLKEIEEKGLQSLDTWKDVDNVKTHFMLIDYVDNTYYEIRARQHDGYTGLTSPVIRRERTNSRDFLARTIGFLLDRDFGVVGEVTNSSDENAVEIKLKGAGLDPQTTPRVKAGDVFSIVEIRQNTATPMQFALLQAQDTPTQNGVVKCRFFHRYKPEGDRSSFQGTPGGQGFRCVKLGTTKAPLVVRLVEHGARTVTPLNGYPIYVHRQGFNEEVEKIEQTATNSDGFTRLLGKEKFYDNVAFIIIRDPENHKEVARVPIPILDDRPVTIALSRKKEAATPVEFHQRIWVQRINKRLVEDAGIFRDLASDTPQLSKLGALLDKARILKVGLDEDIANFSKERKELEAEINATPGAANNLAEGDRLLGLLGKDKKDLEDYISGLVDTVEREKDPVRREFVQMVQQAKSLERDTEYDKAIKLYEKAQQGLNDPSLARQIEKLKASWETKSDDHKAARDFVYKDWPDFDQDHMKEKIAKAHAAFETCKESNDNLTPRKLLRVALTHSTKLSQILEDLHGDVNIEQQKPQAEALEASTALAKLIDAVRKFLEQSLDEK
jgi:tetratricopeptide (TPR) repeat protein